MEETGKHGRIRAFLQMTDALDGAFCFLLGQDIFCLQAETFLKLIPCQHVARVARMGEGTLRILGPIL